MTFQELQDIFQTPWLSPWEHDYYASSFDVGKTSQEFLDYAYEHIEGLTGIWYEISGNSVYFLVKKDTIVPDDFAPNLYKVIDVPEQPAEEGTV